MHAPTNHHFTLVKWILRYIHGTVHHGIRLLCKNPIVLYGFSVADLAGCPTTWCSMTGCCTYLGGNCISWNAKKQPTVARSSSEAEYAALASTAAELTWISFIFRDIGLYLQEPPTLFCDNIPALYMTINLMFHTCTKHIEIDYHFVREKFALGSLITKFVSSKDQVADIIHKSLTKTTIWHFMNQIGSLVSTWAQFKGAYEKGLCGLILWDWLLASRLVVSFSQKIVIHMACCCFSQGTPGLLS